MINIENLKQHLREFADARDWEKFHSPKNLVMALSVEMAELMEHFEWMTEEESLNLDAKTREEVALEMADVMIYLVRMADRCSVDLDDAVQRKLMINAEKYPPIEVLRESKREK
ncbi:MAG: nucleotide pyrophosphohydrolase [Gammaproteobacteria bacterium]|nr:nucleotide pyrophosphohydrolase [Gammaproteobacteria bacterium]